MNQDALNHLERVRPDLVAADDWRQAIDDGRQFLAQWGEQAAAFGWTADDLFGLRDPPERPGPNYRRLGSLRRYGDDLAPARPAGGCPHRHRRGDRPRGRPDVLSTERMTAEKSAEYGENPAAARFRRREPKRP
jgi:hypothetical protein